VDAIDREDADTARTIARNHMATARTLRLQLLREGALKEQLRSYQN
jgi:hypothetical protein